MSADKTSADKTSADKTSADKTPETSTQPLVVNARWSRGGFELSVDEHIDSSGVTAIFGPSGGGKTTLLRWIAGLEVPDEGRIAAGDTVWSGDGVWIPPYDRPVGMLFQDARLFAHLDVAANLAFAERRSKSRAFGLSEREIIDSLDLGPLLHRQVDGLSGGERQRVALGRTLLRRPQWLLLDEPLSALDAERKDEILPYLETLPGRLGIPTLYVSHALDEVVQLADRMLVLADGAVQMHGATVDVVERLDLQPFTGRFSAGVLLQGAVVRHDARLRVTEVAVGNQRLTLPFNDELAPGHTVRLRIRARDVAVATARPQDISIRNILPGRISELVDDHRSAFVEAYISLDEVPEHERVRARLTRAAVEDLKLAPGVAVFALVKSVSFDRRLER